MTIPVFGRVEQPEQMNLEPFPFTIIGYKHLPDGDVEEVPYEFMASGVRPFYIQIDMVRAAAAESGVLSAQTLADYVELSLRDDAERERWRDTLTTPDVFFSADIIGDVSNWLTEMYTGRPTRPRSARRSGPARGGQRSRAAGTGKGGATSAKSQRG